MKKTAIGVAVIGILAIAGSTAVVYKSLQVSSEAKAKVVEYSKVFKLTQRDMASKMIMDWGMEVSPFVGYEYGAEYEGMACWLNKEEYDRYIENQRLIASGATVFEVVANERCIKK